MIVCDLQVANLLMHEIDYLHFIEYLNKLRKYNNFDEYQYVSVYIIRKGNFIHIEKIKGQNLEWTWQLYEYNPRNDYIILEVKLKNLLDNIHPYTS